MRIVHIVSTFYHLEKALVNLNVACDVQNFFTRQTNMIMIIDVASSVIGLPRLQFPTVTNFVELHNSIITSEIMNAPEYRSCGNLSFEELSALKDLKSNVNLVIREADKGCSVVNVV